MTAREYRPGPGWTLMARGDLTVLLPSGQPPELSGALWDTLAGNGVDLYGVLGVLADRFGLARLPAFGIAQHGSSLRVLVRGGVRALVTGPDRSETLSGAEVGTWLERTFADWDSLELGGQPAGAPPEAPAVRLPLLGGVVGADLVHLGSADDAGSAPAAVGSPSATMAAPAPAEGASEETLLPAETLSGNDAAEGPAAEGPAAEGPAAETPDAQGPEAPEATTSTSSYDHLWGTTVLRSVEDAAVRSAGEDVPVQEAAAEAAAGEDAGKAEPVAEPGAGPAPSDVPAPAVWTPPSLLIDSVPWGAPAAPEPDVPPAPVPQAPRSASAGSGRSITSELFGDHDGETVMRSDLDAGALPEAAASDPLTSGADGAQAPGRRAADGPLVLGRRCGQGHANPPSYAQCAQCGEPLEAEPEQMPRPPLGRAVLSTGEVLDLVQPLIVGRQPSVSRVASGGMPRLVSVPSPSGDVSRNHLEVRLEGWHVMVRDLKATNGTVLERPGQAPRRLAQGEMMIVLDGDVADLGDGVTLRFEAVP